jgi:hypothetical protein
LKTETRKRGEWVVGIGCGLRTGVMSILKKKKGRGCELRREEGRGGSEGWGVGGRGGRGGGSEVKHAGIPSNIFTDFQYCDLNYCDRA